MTNKKIAIAYLIISLILLCEIIMSVNNYSFSGYYPDKIIGWLWLAMTVFVIIKLWKKKIIKVYFTLIISGIILSILPMMIPFFGLVHYFSTIGSYQRIQLDDTYRIDRNRPGALYKPQITIYRHEGIFEKQISRTSYDKVAENVLELTYESPIIGSDQPIQSAKIVNVTKDSIGIEYQIMNKKKIYYHKTKENWFED
ncbi:hypothetical protein [Chryseobacterium artocarpi]|nr:hypothetical protein [Chryseobacterium artocarpi]